MSLVAFIATIGLWFAWNYDLKERLQRHPLNLAAHRQAVEDAEGTEKDFSAGTQRVTDIAAEAAGIGSDGITAGRNRAACS